VGLNQLGRSLLCLGRAQDAVPYFDRAIEARPTHKEAWLNKAIALHMCEQGPGALKAVQEALKIDPEYEKAIQVQAILSKAEMGKQKAEMGSGE
jgi:tetratricopeptide (TPR) repeat protein